MYLLVSTSVESHSYSQMPPQIRSTHLGSVLTADFTTCQYCCVTLPGTPLQAFPAFSLFVFKFPDFNSYWVAFHFYLPSSTAPLLHPVLPPSLSHRRCCLFFILELTLHMYTPSSSLLLLGFLTLSFVFFSDRRMSASISFFFSSSSPSLLPSFCLALPQLQSAFFPQHKHSGVHLKPKPKPLLLSSFSPLSLSL